MLKSALRAAAFSLLLALLLVPALTRVSQVLNVTASANPAIGFSKSGDKPPDRIALNPHFNLITLVVREVTPGYVVVLPLGNETPPASARVFDVGGLRAPPVTLAL